MRLCLHLKGCGRYDGTVVGFTSAWILWQSDYTFITAKVYRVQWSTTHGEMY